MEFGDNRYDCQPAMAANTAKKRRADRKEGENVVKPKESSTAVDFVPQFAGALEGHHFSGSQHHIITRRGISASAFLLLVNAKLAKPADHDILSVLQCPFDDFEEGFHQFNGSVPRKTKLFLNAADDLSLRECWHMPAPF